MSSGWSSTGAGYTMPRVGLAVGGRVGEGTGVAGCGLDVAVSVGGGVGATVCVWVAAGS